MKSLKSRLLTFTVLATLIPSIGLGLLSFWRYQALITDATTQEMRMQASHATRELELWLRERISEVRALAASNAVQDGLAAPASGSAPAGARSSQQALTLYLRSVQARLDSLRELTVVDADGNVLASSAAEPMVPPLPAAWTHAGVSADVVIAPPPRPGAGSSATLTVLVPVRSAPDRVQGALAAVLELDRTLPRLRGIVRATPTTLIVLGPHGIPLLDTDAAPGRSASFDSPEYEQLRAHPGEPTVIGGRRAGATIGLADRPGSLPLTIIAERDRGDVYRAWLRSLLLFTGLVAGLTLLVGAIAYWMGHTIVRPLEGLVDASERIAGGDLAVRLAVTDDGEIGKLTRAFNVMADRLRRSREELGRANQALQEQNRLLEELSITDSLTGVYNRKRLDEILIEQFGRYQRNRKPFALIMLDIDNFKKLNDTYGHLAGDAVLANLAAVLKRSVRSIDYVARYGGEEFVVVLVEASAAEAAQVAERIRTQMEAPDPAGARAAATVSLGVTESLPDDDSPAAMLARADRAMYVAKQAGRNRVCAG